MSQTNSGMYDWITAFNHSDFRKRMIPMEMVSGWPCIRNMGKTLCVTLPFYSRQISGERIALFPLYCSVTVPLGNRSKLVDFTIYPYQTSWRDVDYSKPIGYFKHSALSDVKTNEEYQSLCRQLYDYYDAMIACVREHKPTFPQESQMQTLFTKLMEPAQYPQYLRINRKFYEYFCRY